MESWQIIITVILSIVSAMLYRMGGYGKPFNKLYRRIGCPLTSLALVLVIGIHVQWWLYIPYVVASYGAILSYNDYWDTDGVEWFEWLLTGFVYAMPAAVICITWGHWVGFFIRTAVVIVGVTLVSVSSKNVWVEELGRGLIIAATIPLLLI